MNDDISVIQVLHDTRTAYLRDLKVKGKTLISVGADNLGYMNWVHANSGLPARHIGVEYYATPPQELPENIEWVTNTAGNMHSIGDGVGDVLFSGQNIEHLWEDEVIGFLLDANRVLRHDGLLVVDSPNRAITSALCIVHPEHMVEMEPREIEELMNAAGFSVVQSRGIYLCRDPRDGTMLPYQPSAMLGADWSLSERIALSDRHPADCYIWWIEARKTGPADVQRIQSLVARYWAIGWPERMNRLMTAIGVQDSDEKGAFFRSDAGPRGAVIYGPYAPLKAGRYRVTAKIALADDSPLEAVVGTLDVMLGPNNIVAEIPIKSTDLETSNYRSFSIDFETTLETTFGFQWRVMALGICGLRVDRQTRLEKIEQLPA